MLEAVNDGNDAHPLFELLKRVEDFLRGEVLLVAQTQGLADDESLALGGGLGINDVRCKIGVRSGKSCRLECAGQLLGNRDDDDLIPRRGGILIRLYIGGRAGLAGAGQLAVGGQTGKIIILRHRAVILLRASVHEGDGHRHNGNAGGVQLRRGQIGGGIGENTDHSYSFL